MKRLLIVAAVLCLAAVAALTGYGYWMVGALPH